jgi:hypothetical protein
MSNTFLDGVQQVGQLLAKLCRTGCSRLTAQGWIFIFSQTNKLRNLWTDRDSNGIMSRSFLTVAE